VDNASTNETRLMANTYVQVGVAQKAHFARNVA
jgi:hypothetical protein